jgi:ubiquinone/menaquinone biosynthesis C-methylase UbiE
MEEHFQQETERLQYSWMKHDGRVLRNYLVEDVQDPRINVQSILSRHWLIEQLFGDKFNDLAEHELRYALVMNWLNKLYKANTQLWQMQSVLHSLVAGQSNADGIEIPSYITQTFSCLAMPNYMVHLLNWAPFDRADITVPEYLLTTFQQIWLELLEQEQLQKISILEPACGSANDYRFLASFGIARFLDYQGFDLCRKNIVNAKKMFPDVNFDVGNVLEIHAQDKTYDYCMVHDLFEHLSIEAMQLAVKEVCRVTRKGLCISFFNMSVGQEHIVNPVQDYHWNQLSLPLMVELFKQHFSRVQVIHIDDFLTSKFSCGDTKNKNAYIFIVS